MSPHTLKKCSLLKIENNRSWDNFIHFREKKPPSRTWVDFRQHKRESLHTYKIWFLKWKIRMVWKLLIFAKWTIRNNLDAIAAVHGTVIHTWLSFRDIARWSGWHPYTVMRAWNQWVVVCHTELHAGSQPPPIINAREYRNIVRSAMQNHINTSLAISQYMGTFASCPVSARAVRRHLQHTQKNVLLNQHKFPLAHI